MEMEGQSARILVVDDEVAIRLTLEMLLNRRGYAVMTAAGGQEALELVEQHGFDLILLDLNLPGMNGLDVAHQIRVRRPAARIMLLTGQDVPGQQDDRAAGFACMSKTISPQDVLARVAAALKP
jgi:two-component system response regulator MprA